MRGVFDYMKSEKSGLVDSVRRVFFNIYKNTIFLTNFYLLSLYMTTKEKYLKYKNKCTDLTYKINEKIKKLLLEEPLQNEITIRLYTLHCCTSYHIYTITGTKFMEVSER